MKSKYENSDIDRFALHEVYYDDDGCLSARTENPVTIESEDEDYLDWLCGAIQLAFTKPILTDEDIDGKIMK